MVAFYVSNLDYPTPRFTKGSLLGNAFYDALGIGLPFVASFTLARLSSTSWRATFAKPVYDYPPMRLRECYVFSPELTVQSVSPSVDVGSGRINYVDIVTSEQGPVTYTLTIYGAEPS